MLTLIENDIIKMEYEERLKEAEMLRRLRKAQKGRPQQRKGFFASLLKNLPQLTPAKPALRIK